MDARWNVTTLKPVYMTKDPASRSILTLTTCSCKSECKGNCSCKNTGLSCSESRVCMADVDVCKNPHGVILDVDSDSDDSDSE